MIPRYKSRLEVVDTICQLTQWSLSADYPMGYYNQIRCLYKGLGDQLQGEEYGRPLDIPQDIYHIDNLELLAAFLALKSFASHWELTTILLRLDNIMAIDFLNKMGGTHSQI